LCNPRASAHTYLQGLLEYRATALVNEANEQKTARAKAVEPFLERLGGRNVSREIRNIQDRFHPNIEDRLTA
jgi:hypothetical protein